MVRLVLAHTGKSVREPLAGWPRFEQVIESEGQIAITRRGKPIAPLLPIEVR